MSSQTKTRRKVVTKQLPLAQEIDWVPRKIAPGLLDICGRQLRRDLSVLQKLEPPGFSYESRKGFWRDTVQVLWEFRQITKDYGRAIAISIINEHMEDFWNGQER
jgi:hypothetical protein